MKAIISISLVLAVLSITGIGCMVIFDVMQLESAKSLALKSVAAIILLAVSSAIIAWVAGYGPETDASKPDDNNPA